MFVVNDLPREDFIISTDRRGHANRLYKDL